MIKLAKCLDGEIVKDKDLAYPRVCAHRGFNSVAPENTMPAWGLAVALGAPEIEFDLWRTKDGVIVSCHDPNLDRVSTGTGMVLNTLYLNLKITILALSLVKSLRTLKSSNLKIY